MHEPEPERVQGLTAEVIQARIAAAARPVRGVAHQRMAEVRHVHANLMRAPGFDLNIQERRTWWINPFPHNEM